MSEDFWERRQRHLNEDHNFRRQQSKRDIEIRKVKARIDEREADIARHKREIDHGESSEKLKALLDEMQRDKVFILSLISACSSVHKDQWSERLSRIDLTHPSADAELKNLREEVEKEKSLWSGTPRDLPAMSDLWKHLSGAEGSLSMDSAPAEKSKTSSLPDAVELRLNQEQSERIRERELKEGDLALIASTLGLLISSRNLYETIRSTS